MRYATLTRDIMTHEDVADDKVWPREVILTPTQIATCETETHLLDAIFQFGQNDFQPKAAPSLSVGDLIILADGTVRKIETMGFAPVSRASLTPQERIAVDFAKADFEAFKAHMFEEAERGMVVERKLDPEVVEHFRASAAQS